MNAPAFWHNAYAFHYTAGPLLDRLTGVLAALGLATALATPRRLSTRLILVWLAVGFGATGLLSPYPDTAISRLYVLLPPLCLLAGAAAAGLCERVAETATAAIGRRWQKGLAPPVAAALPALLLTGLLVGAAALNGHRAHNLTPAVYPYRMEALALGVYHSRDCGADAARTVFVGFDAADLNAMLESYRPDGPYPALATTPPDGWPAGLRCAIFAGNDRELRQTARELASGDGGDGEHTRRARLFSAPGGQRSVVYVTTTGRIPQSPAPSPAVPWLPK